MEILVGALLVGLVLLGLALWVLTNWYFQQSDMLQQLAKETNAACNYLAARITKLEAKKLKTGNVIPLFPRRPEN